MKIQVQSGRQGNVLIVCLFTATVIGITLASYLNMVNSQNLSVTRSQYWNDTVPVLEAGIEEAMAHINHNGLTNLYRDGWYVHQTYGVSNGVYKVRFINNDAFYTVISNTAGNPMIFSRGYVKKPLKNNQWVTRQVLVNAQRDALFAKGLVAKGQIKLNGNNVLVDSFDSADSSYSSNGVYLASKRKDNGDVATNLQITNALSGGNATIYGNASTGPGGTVGIGSNGAVGTKAFIDGGNTGIQSGRSSDDMNVSFPDVELPFLTAPVPSSGGGYEWILNATGDYAVSQITGNVLVRSNVVARLLVTSTISITGSDNITIEPGGKLDLYMDGTTAKIAGNGVVNQAGNATNFFYWGTPNNKSLTINGNGSFVGVIYSPNADFTFNGSGSGSDDFVGASVSGSVSMNGNFQFHYDENLGRLDKDRGYIVTDWNEI